jgi:hypothetical protein
MSAERRIEMFFLHHHDDPMHRPIANLGKVGKLTGNIFEEGGSAIRWQRMRGGEHGGYLRVGEREWLHVESSLLSCTCGRNPRAAPRGW